MERYNNLSTKSGVTAYEIGDSFIRVQFKGGSIYRYTYSSTGKDRVEMMKDLACRGQGLSTFISRCVKKDYASKE